MLHLHTGIVELKLVRDFSVLLLCCVPVHGRNIKFGTIIYDKLHYVPMSLHHIDMISIEKDGVEET